MQKKIKKGMQKERDKKRTKRRDKNPLKIHTRYVSQKFHMGDNGKAQNLFIKTKAVFLIPYPS